jgi:hypothetical protein
MRGVSGLLQIIAKLHGIETMGLVGLKRADSSVSPFTQNS